MSLNNISLSIQSIADLYPSSLVEAEAFSNKEKQVKFLGNNEKNILILVSKENIPFIEENELNFLSNVLNACKLSLADVAIINLKMAETSNYRSLIEQLKSKTILLFDVDTQTIELPFNFPHFQLQQFDQSTYLSAPALSFIEREKSLKTQLWNCLKTVFYI